MYLSAFVVAVYLGRYIKCSTFTFLRRLTIIIAAWQRASQFEPIRLPAWFYVCSIELFSYKFNIHSLLVMMIVIINTFQLTFFFGLYSQDSLRSLWKPILKQVNTISWISTLSSTSEGSSPESVHSSRCSVQFFTGSPNRRRVKHKNSFNHNMSSWTIIQKT